MTERVRQGIAGLCLAVCLLLVGGIALAASGPGVFGGLALLAGATIAIVCLVNIATGLASRRDLS